MERVDIVDAHDVTIDSANRKVVHEKELLHRVVMVFVFNPKGELFMQKRSYDKDFFPGSWEGSLSGHVLTGESSLLAAERELNEELGTHAKLHEVIQFGMHVPPERVLVRLFVARDFDREIEINTQEVAEGKFMSSSKIEELLKKGECTPFFEHAWRLFSQLGQSKKELI